MPDPSSPTAKLVDPIPTARRPSPSEVNVIFAEDQKDDATKADTPKEPESTLTQVYTLRGAVERLHASIEIMDECITRSARLRKILKGDIPENGSKMDSPPKPTDAQGAMEALHNIITAYESRIKTLIVEQTHIEGVL